MDEEVELKGMRRISRKERKVKSRNNSRQGAQALSSGIYISYLCVFAPLREKYPN
jgi:hypothetical protein